MEGGRGGYTVLRGRGKEIQEAKSSHMAPAPGSSKTRREQAKTFFLPRRREASGAAEKFDGFISLGS